MSARCLRWRSSPKTLRRKCLRLRQLYEVDAVSGEEQGPEEKRDMASLFSYVVVGRSIKGMDSSNVFSVVWFRSVWVRLYVCNFCMFKMVQYRPMPTHY